MDALVAFPAALDVAHSLGDRAWRWRPAEDRTGFAISQKFDVPELLGRIMAGRGLTLETAADFLTPKLRAMLPDPNCLADMPAAANRLARAVQTHEKIAVFGDYDVDGACSAALLTLFLRDLGCEVLTYVPDRMREGYGPNAPALLALAAQGATLIICVDCGTAATTALAALKGVADAIVLDHHKAEGPPPPILATVNPNRLDCRSGLNNICAAAVTFITVAATVRALRRDGFFAARPEPDLMQLLDLVALATVCDVMPLTGLNRALVSQGLKIMGTRRRVGINALLDVAKVKDAPTASTCGFALGPRINAGGRISESDLGLRLLLCEDPLDAKLLAERLDAVNRQRQNVEAGMLETATDLARAQVEAGHGVIVISGQNWHPGVVGIVAGRLKEKFNRPVCVGGADGALIKGSGRSIPGQDLGAAIIAARQHGILATGGGHAMAAGFTYHPAQTAAFQAFLEESLVPDPHAPARPHLDIDAAITPAGATLELAKSLSRLAPLGAGNEEPVLVLPRIRIIKTDRIGNDANTLRAMIEGEGGAKLKAILFRAADTPLARALSDRAGPRLHLAGHLRAESWQGRETVSFIITDAALA
jgi:single-stranded-DNA-specific exonuclease